MAEKRPLEVDDTCPSDCSEEARESKRAKNEKRFPSPIKSEALQKATEGVVPNNTKQSTRWALNTFLTWARERNKRCPDEEIDETIFCCPDAERVSHVLCLFTLEARKVDGERYPPSILRNLLSGLNREFVKNKVTFGIFDKNDHRFTELRNTLDSVNSQLHRDGIGVSTNHAEVLTVQDEDLCWEKGTLGVSSLTVLQHTVFFYIGLHFVLRSVQEQYDLMVSQLKRVPEDLTVYDRNIYYQYSEYISKNNVHFFTDAKMKNKVVAAYAQPGSSRCLVSLLDRYLPLLPSGTEHVYMRPAKEFSADSPAYYRQRVGINTIKKFVHLITSGAGLVGYTNHCLRATAMTRMFNSGVPEKVIADKSGHRSLDGLRAYEHPNEELYRAAEEIISDPTKKFD
ncbi:PREDICTED: uncharacterized protein KIAA1958-like [Amphimedon queenslandica]|uniref:ZMYM2-like/QRICH1 C-terminal domain-containing protein n=1 Tax=Amphimedon queenslandica TaxID=400682 RepID=A0A1X7SVM5_AMPQE|nr:PREDICTED: uncharacterized protein KIAA1958-like [Amphimedon queenslandica]|eukprot:XP_011408773.1 PREDICTED: uncharacterized protein KIAA1958-like [Amphimedon queenslandica]